MITVTANARNATCRSDDLLTSGSVGMLAQFILSEDFDGLSNIAVFQGSGQSFDVALVDNECVVPHEVLAVPGDYLKIGVYGRNSEGTIVIPTIWAGVQMIVPGTQPSGVDPAEPTPDWTAQVQEMATEALEAAESVVARADAGEFDGAPGVSPTVAVTAITGGHRVTVTDADGTRSFDVLDGTDGEDGRGIASAVLNADYTLTLTYTDGTSYTTPSLRGAPGDPGTPGISPTVTVTDITGGHRITITDADGAHSFDVPNGEDGVGIPTGGTTGQVLSKASGTDYDTEWTTPEPGGVQDVQVNGVSVLSNGVANVPAASTDGLGTVKIKSGDGVNINANNELVISHATAALIKSGTNISRPITPGDQHNASFYGLATAAGDTTQKNSANAVGTYTDAAKSAISQMLSGSVSVSGTTPTITALPGIRYVCGEVATLDITLPASGIVDVVFTSGSTATVLTITPPTGQTLKWANGFDPTSLDANATYEINIADGLGVAASWT